MTTRAIIYGSDDNRQVVRAVRQGEVCSVPTNAWIDWQRQRGRERGGEGKAEKKEAHSPIHYVFQFKSLEIFRNSSDNKQFTAVV